MVRYENTKEAAMTTQAKFRKVLHAILEANVTTQLSVLWKEYLENLRDIDPMEIPEKLRPKFIKMKEILEKRMEDNVDTSLYFKTYGKPFTVEEREAERLKVIAGRARQRPLHNFGNAPAKLVRTTLLEMVEKLPKREKK